MKLIKIPILPYKTDNNSSTPWMSYPSILVIRCHVPSVLHYDPQWCLQYFIKIHKNTVDTSLNYLKIDPSVLINLPPQGCILINWNSPILQIVSYIRLATCELHHAWQEHTEYCSMAQSLTNDPLDWWQSESISPHCDQLTDKPQTRRRFARMGYSSR